VAIGAVDMSVSGAAKLTVGGCLSVVISLVEVVPGSGDTVFADIVLMAGVRGATFKVAALIAPASLLPEGDGRRTRRCDFRGPVDGDFVPGERVFGALVFV